MSVLPFDVLASLAGYTKVALDIHPHLSGGPAGLIYSYIAVWIGFTSIFIALGELASMIPSAGGQYHWASILAPKSSTRFFSHVTGT
ncbi:unnamed protein product [Penicillium viridicatum]